MLGNFSPCLQERVVRAEGEGRMRITAFPSTLP